MLYLGSVLNGGLTSQQRVSISMQYKFLAQSLLSEGNSKQHCSWVNVGGGDDNFDGVNRGKDSFRDECSDLYQVCQQVSELIQVRHDILFLS